MKDGALMDARSRYVLFGLLGLVLAAVAFWNFSTTQTNSKDTLPFSESAGDEGTASTLLDSERVDIVMGGTTPRTNNTRVPVTDEDGRDNDTTEDSGTSAAVASALAPNGIALPTRYETQIEDTLISISTKFYGTPNHWRLIADANNISKPERMRRGQVLDIPVPPGTQPASTVTTQPDNATQVSTGAYYHTIKKNEKLWNIAEKYYGKGHLYKKIVAANTGLNPNVLPVGKKILIPDYSPHNE